MSETRNEPMDSPAGAADASSAAETLSSGDATYTVRFSQFWSSSRASNSFDLARRGEIRFSGDALIVHAFQREFGFFGSRIELKFARADIADVSQRGNFVSFRIVHPNQDAKTLGFWAEDEGDAKRIAHGLPGTESAAGIAVKEYQAQLKSLDRGDHVTKALVAANVLFFGVACAAGAGFVAPQVEVLQQLGTNVGPLTLGGQWWRLITSMFLHFGVFHLAFNMWALWVGGRLAERLFGSGAFALIYFAAGLAGSLSSVLWNPAINSAGASGAIFGVYGAMLAFYLRKHAAIPPEILSQQRWSGVVFIGYNLMNGFAHAGIDNAAHLGGLGVGFVMGLVLARPLALDARTRFSAASLYTRGGIAALAMIGALFVALRLSPAGNNPDQRFLRDLAAMEGLERVAQQSFNEAINQFGSHQLTTSEVAQRIDSEVLPRWFLIQRTVQKDRVADDSKLKPLWELIDDYSESRMAAFQLFESGYRQGRAADFRAAQAKLDQGNVDLKLISDLRQRPK